MNPAEDTRPQPDHADPRVSPTSELGLDRLLRLLGSDPGFYVLALHAFIEHYVVDVVQVPSLHPLASRKEFRFREVIGALRTWLLEQSGGSWVSDLDCLQALGQQHTLTNRVRHSFGTLTEAEAIAATHLFVRFCALVGLDSEEAIRALSDRQRDAWGDPASLLEHKEMLAAVRGELLQIRRREEDLLSRMRDWETERQRLADLTLRLERTELQLDQTRSRLTRKDERLDELRAERQRLRQEHRDLSRSLEAYGELERYIESLGRLTAYTRSRVDYERTLLELTRDQADAVAQAATPGDLLIRGEAGTGKSLVLVRAFIDTLRQGEFEFANGPSRTAVVLTFTRALARFEDYLFSVIGEEIAPGTVSTVDAFIRERLKRLDASWEFQFDVVKELSAELNTTDFLDNAELALEIEDFLFGRMVSKVEYLGGEPDGPGGGIERSGMRRPLGRQQRAAVWDIAAKVALTMEERRRCSRNYARLVILRAISEGNEMNLADTRVILVDESQDLTAGDLRCLRALAREKLILAADAGQSIYRGHSPYARAGLDLRGRTRHLRTNFRNTRQVQQAAAHFYPSADDAGPALALREGPPIQIHRARDARDAESQLLSALSIYLDHLAYDPANVAVLAPHNSVCDRVEAALADAGRPLARIRSGQDFDFRAQGAIRLTTLHSSKGLDFPVVILFLPELERRHQFDDETTERLYRNLLYVGMTRAMDQLRIIVNPEADPLYAELAELAETE